MRSILLRALTVLVLLTAPLLGHAQSLSITPITWNVIGLDSNKVADGPNQFPVGARICNTDASTPVGNVTATFAWTGGSLAINLIGTSTIALGTLSTGPLPVPSQYTINSTPANCADAYFNVEITRANASWNTTRSYVITAASTNAASVTTPIPREVYVEKLVSQNRNGVVLISGPTDVFVGDTYTYTYNTKTATGGYEQLENFIYWPNTIFQILSVSSSYAQPAGGINSTAYGDACGWENNPGSANYRSCVGPLNYTGGKAGGDPILTTYVVKILSPATTGVTGVVHDYSGSSYHYNSDYGQQILSVTSRYRSADLVISKTDGVTSVVQGNTTTYTLVISNLGPDPATSTVIQDPAVAGLTKTSLSCAASAGTSCPGTLTLAALEGSGLVVTSMSVNATLTLTVAALVTSGSGTVTNVATVTPGVYVVDSNPANNTATDVDRVQVPANLSVSKSNGVGTLTAGQTTSYTVTVANGGPGAADGAVLADQTGTGLSCSSATCVGTTGGASCPSGFTLNTPVAAGSTTLFSSGVALTTLPASSSVTLLVNCLVTASGV